MDGKVWGMSYATRALYFKSGMGPVDVPRYNSNIPVKSRLRFLCSDGKGVHTRTQGQGGEGDSGQETGVGDQWTDTGVVLASTDPSVPRLGTRGPHLPQLSPAPRSGSSQGQAECSLGFLPLRPCRAVGRAGWCLHPDALSLPQPLPTTSSLLSSSTWSSTCLPLASALAAASQEGSCSRL